MKFYLVLNVCDLNNSTFIKDFLPLQKTVEKYDMVRGVENFKPYGVDLRPLITYFSKYYFDKSFHMFG